MTGVQTCALPIFGKVASYVGAQGETAKMMCYKRLSNMPYETEIFSYDISAIANQEKTIPLEWISENKNDVTEELVSYLRPLIMGESEVIYENGLPAYCNISHLHTKDFSKK